MVRVACINSRVVSLSRLSQYTIWFDYAYDSADFAAQIEIGDKRAVWKPEPVQFGDSEHLGCIGLLESTHLRNLFARDRVVRTTCLTVGHETINDLIALCDPICNRAACTKIDIVRMRHNHQNFHLCSD